MERTNYKKSRKKLPAEALAQAERNEESYEDEHDHIVEIPLIIRRSIISIQPLLTIIIPIQLEDVRIAVRVHCIQSAF